MKEIISIFLKKEIGRDWGSVPCTNASPAIWVSDICAKGLKREVEKRHEGRRRLQPY